MAKKPRSEKKATLRDLGAWELPADEIDRLLATEDDPRLRALFGADYEELRQLARKSAGAVRGTQNIVLLVPGILGSTLGKPGNFLTRDTIWFDPVSIALGEIAKLKLPPSGQSKFEALDVVPVVHTYLRLRLRMFGFTVEYYAYDWRQSIAKLGQDLAHKIRSSHASKVMLVAHSMGGLVCRAALRAGADKVTRLVMLGTPNRGSFSPVEVMQGINSTVVMVDRLDPTHDAAQLTKEVFSTFPSVYEMLPRPEVFGDVDLFEPTNWPSKPFRPAAQRLRDAQATWKKLVAGNDPRLYLIAGHQQPTVTGLSVEPNGEFSYHTSLQGDGTVPLKMCELPGVPTRYVPTTHTGLLRHEGVARAVAELLQDGVTAELDSRPSDVRGGASGRMTRAEFQQRNQVEMFAGRRGAGIAGDELPRVVEAAMSLSSMPAAETLQAIERDVAAQRGGGSQPPAALPGAGAASSGRLTTGINFKQTVISRDLQTHLELELYHGSLFDVPYRAVLLGIFKNVDPTGPAQILDTLTHGAVTELLERRMFDAEVGKVFVMPTGRHTLRADQVIFVGLGSYNQFLVNAERTLRSVACNVLRTLKHCGVDEFATLIYGGSSGLPVRQAVESFVRGFVDALKVDENDEDALQFRRIAFCETSPEKYAELKDEAFRLGGTDLCQDIRLRLHEAHYPASSTLPAPPSREQVERRTEITYLTVRAEEDRHDQNQWTIFASLLSSGGKATIFPSAVQIDRRKLEHELRGLAGASLPKLLALGDRLKRLLLTNDFIEVLHKSDVANTHLAVIHDGLASRVPWEILPLTGPQGTAAVLPCLGEGLSRRYQTDGKNSVAKFLEVRQRSEILKVLLIANPTNDLPGAAREGKAVKKVLQAINQVSFVELDSAEATRPRILKLVGSGEFDVVHYAGHAFFDPEDRGRSGLICAGNTILTGRDIAQCDKLPSLVCFNACESGRIRSRFAADRAGPESPTRKRKDGIETGDVVEQNVGVAEALLRGGIAQFVGTYWPVDDLAAATFAASLYRSIATGKTVREAVIDARAAIRQDPDLVDFANYLHFGSPNFVVKEV